MIKHWLLLISALLFSTVPFASEQPSQQLASEKASVNIDKLTVYVAKKIITMEPSVSEVDAVAVANGRIVATGTLESLNPWTKRFPTEIDNTFKDKTLLPGFIDPHVHPSLPATLTLFPFIAPDDWELPTGSFPGAKNQSQYLLLLKKYINEFSAQHDQDSQIPFITWGFHQLWHGDIYRKKLDDLYPDTPVILWHRSFHELVANSAALDQLGLNYKDHPEHLEGVDWQKGLFSEHGLAIIMPELMKRILTPARYTQEMEHFVKMLHQGGVTSAMDMGIGIFGDPAGEAALIRHAMADAPTRMILTPIITHFSGRKIPPEDALIQVKEWKKLNSDKVKIDGHFKLMMDGAAFSGLGQMDFPGYIDGHEGVWASPLDVIYAYAKVFWDNGYQLHAHTNGDKSADALIKIVKRLQDQKPRSDHRTVLEHFMYATEDQLQQMGRLGMAVSANPYYQYILADMYAENWLGEDRGRNISPLKGVKRASVPLALHSDCPMAPLSPLTLVWAAVNRKTINGNQNNETQSLNLDEALRAVTIDAAWMMRKENSLGSIRAGKKADFTVLHEDPYSVDPMKIKDIKVWGTVFEGQKYPLN